MLTSARRRNPWPTLPAALLACAVPLAEAAAVESKSEAGLALIRTASPEPVDVVISATNLEHGTESIGPLATATDKRIVFRLPAAYVGEPHAYPMPEVQGWLTLRVWSRTFDPVAPDEVADLFSCPDGHFAPCRAPDPEGGRVAARRRAGESPVLIWVTDKVGTEAHRRHTLAYAAGLAGWEGRRGKGRDPCEAHWDETLGMIVSRPPERVPPGFACNLAPYPLSLDGRALTPATFLKVEPDGTPRFAASCPDYAPPADPRSRYSRCRLLGSFGPWPLVMYVPSGDAAAWQPLLDRLRDFLAQHTVSRTE